MVKKILFGIVIAGISGVLIFGGINRTIAQAANAEVGVTDQLRLKEAASINSRLELQEQKNLGIGIGNGGVGLGKGGDGVTQPESGNGNGRGTTDDKRPGLGDGVPLGDGIPDAVVEEWVTIEGTVTALNADMLQITTSDGQVILVENRAWWFAQEQGVVVQVGDSVSLLGFYEDTDFEVGTLTNLNSGQLVSLRNDSGQPLWSGKGNAGGKGGGNK